MAKKLPLYQKADEICLAISRMGWPWAKDVAEYLARHLVADAKRPATAGKGSKKYSAEIRELIIAAIPPEVLHTPKATSITQERISLAGPEAYGLRREPDVETVRAAIVEARCRSRDSLINSRLSLRTLNLSSSSSST